LIAEVAEAQAVELWDGQRFQFSRRYKMARQKAVFLGPAWPLTAVKAKQANELALRTT